MGSAEQNVSLRRRISAWLLGYRNTIAAYIGSLFILNGIDADVTVYIGVGFLIGWFIDD